MNPASALIGRRLAPFVVPSCLDAAAVRPPQPSSF